MSTTRIFTSNVVCLQLEKRLRRDFTCGNAGVNSYGVDNMAERIRYKDFSDESAVVVSIVSFNAVHGLVDIGSVPYFTVPPPGPFKGLWEAATIGSWQLLQLLRYVQYDNVDDLPVAERSLGHLLDALRETDRPGRKVLIVLMPMRDELNGHETELTKRVRAPVLEALRAGVSRLCINRSRPLRMPAPSSMTRVISSLPVINSSATGLRRNLKACLPGSHDFDAADSEIEIHKASGASVSQYHRDLTALA